MALTEKQKIWIAAYLGSSHYNASAAARVAGYEDPGQSGWLNKINVEIQAEIQKQLKENCLTPEEVLSRLSDEARGYGAYIKGSNGNTSIDTTAMLKDGKGHLIKGVKRTKYGRDVELADPHAALVKIGEHHKLFTQKIDLSGLSNDQLISLLAVGSGTGGETPGAEDPGESGEAPPAG